MRSHFAMLSVNAKGGLEKNLSSIELDLSGGDGTYGLEVASAELTGCFIVPQYNQQDGEYRVVAFSYSGGEQEPQGDVPGGHRRQAGRGRPSRSICFLTCY